MAWTESRSPSFVARHEQRDAHHVADLLADLEGFRGELAERFERVPGDVSVIVHASAAALSLAQPWLPLARRFVAPAGRRYMAGWFSRGELHVLAPAALERRASGVEGSREALLLSPLHEYAHLVLGANNPLLPPPFGPRRFERYLRQAWLAEGAATHLAGQTPYLRGAIARRLHEGGPPAFPPAARDAPLLGCTVFAALERRTGADAVARLALADSTAPRRALEQAFGVPLRAIEHDWRAALARLAGPRASVSSLEERRAARET